MAGIQITIRNFKIPAVVFLLAALAAAGWNFYSIRDMKPATVSVVSFPKHGKFLGQVWDAKSHALPSAITVKVSRLTLPGLYIKGEVVEIIYDPTKDYEPDIVASAAWVNTWYQIWYLPLLLLILSALSTVLHCCKQS